MEAWPEAKDVDQELLKEMQYVRVLVSLALEIRAKASIKVRQPLQKMEIREAGLKNKKVFLDLIKDEVNIKEIVINSEIKNDVELDIVISPELKLEGQAREFIRAVQDARKKADFNPTDRVALTVVTNEKGKKCIEAYTSEISKTAQLSAIHFSETEGEKIQIDDMEFVIHVEKAS